MTHVLTAHPAAIGSRTGFAGSIRSLPQAALWFSGAVVVFSILAVANVPVRVWLDGAPQHGQRLTAEPVPETAASLDQDAGNTRVRARCPTCGVVQAIRRIDAAGDTPESYEFTVRLRDGSIHLSRDASQAKWRAGDNIMLIGGANPAGQ
jgi:homospermidine synthase